MKDAHSKMKIKIKYLSDKVEYFKKTDNENWIDLCSAEIKKYCNNDVCGI